MNTVQHEQIRALAREMTKTTQHFWRRVLPRGQTTDGTEGDSMAAAMVFYVMLAATMDEPEEWLDRAHRYFQHKDTRKFMSDFRVDFLNHRAKEQAR